VCFSLGIWTIEATPTSISIVEERWTTVACYCVDNDGVVLQETVANATDQVAWSPRSDSLERIDLRPGRLSLVAGKRAWHWAMLPSEIAIMRQWFGMPRYQGPIAIALPKFFMIDQTLIVCVGKRRWVCDAHGCQQLDPPLYSPHPLSYRHRLRGPLHSAPLGKGRIVIGRNSLLIVDQQRHADTYAYPGLWRRLDRALW